RYDVAIDVLNRAAKREPMKPRYRDALAAAHLEAGHFDHALSELKELERLAPSTKLLHYRQGKALERMGKKPEAVAEYREALRRDKSAWQVAVDCARAYEAMGDKNNLLLSLTFLDHALKFNPRSHEALFTQQAVYRKLGNRDESKRVNALYQNLIDFKHQREEELRAFKTRTDEDPRDFEAWLGTIKIRSRFNAVEDVLRDVFKMLNVEPNHPDGLWHLINLLLVQKKNLDAYFQACKLMDTNPEDSRGTSMAATALFRLNRAPEATKMARDAFAVNPRDGAALEILVLALQKLDPKGKELASLLPMYQRMKAEEEALIEQMQAQEDQLNKSLGK
ncbi:MAG: tetratricopeptide (TPR) repeat protein, partial [Planctomycetota bacterium]